VYLGDIAKELEKQGHLYRIYSNYLNVTVSNFSVNLNGRENGII